MYKRSEEFDLQHRIQFVNQQFCDRVTLLDEPAADAIEKLKLLKQHDESSLVVDTTLPNT